jgi:hypothetical protein
MKMYAYLFYVNLFLELLYLIGLQPLQVASAERGCHCRTLNGTLGWWLPLRTDC